MEANNDKAERTIDLVIKTRQPNQIAANPNTSKKIILSIL